LPRVCDNIVPLLTTGKRIGPALLNCNIKTELLLWQLSTLWTVL